MKLVSSSRLIALTVSTVPKIGSASGLPRH